MKIFGYLKPNEIDRVWFNSSNIMYGECDDIETTEKTVRIVFNNGKQYEYKNVNVFDWVSLKNAHSQGKEFDSKFKKYEFTKLEDVDIEALKEECFFRSGNGYYIKIVNEEFTLTDCEDNVKCVINNVSDKESNDIEEVLKSVGLILKHKQ